MVADNAEPGKAQEFFKEYLKPECASKQQLLYVMNPTKFMACEFLIRYHEHTRGDKARPTGGCEWTSSTQWSHCNISFGSMSRSQG